MKQVEVVPVLRTRWVLFKGYCEGVSLSVRAFLFIYVEIIVKETHQNKKKTVLAIIIVDFDESAVHK